MVAIPGRPPALESIAEAMQDNINLRRHAGACRYYREDWNVPDALYRC